MTTRRSTTLFKRALALLLALLMLSGCLGASALADGEPEEAAAEEAHEHSFTAVGTQDAGCTEPGFITWACDCGESYTEALAATGHTPGHPVIENEIEPSCEAEGSLDYVVYCSVCGAELSRETVTLEKAAHRWDGGVVTAEPTAEAEGETTYTCLVCGAVRTEAIEPLPAAEPAAGEQSGGAETEPEEPDVSPDGAALPTPEPSEEEDMVFAASTIEYVDTNGVTQTVVADRLTAESKDLYGGWYVVAEDTTFNELKFADINIVVNIILCDGVRAGFNSGGRIVSNYANSSLVFWGQTAGSGVIDITYFSRVDNITVNGGKLHCSSSGYSYAIDKGNLTVNGGEVQLPAEQQGSVNGDLTFNGGSLQTAGKITGNTSLNYSSASDRVKVAEYGGSVTVAEGKYFKDANGNFYCGTLSAAQKNAVKNATLQPAPNAHTVTVGSVSNGTVTANNAIAETDSTVTLTVTPEEGYELDTLTVTWSGGAVMTEGTGNTYSFTMPAGDAAIGAAMKLSYYPISYEDVEDASFDASNPESYTVLSGDITLNNPTREGYDFAGWTGTELDGATETVTIPTGSTGDRVYTATWEAHEYTVSFDGNGATDGSMSTQDFTYGEAQTLTANAFTRTGYSFDCWTTQADGSGDSYTDGQNVQNLSAEDGDTVTLYARWEPNTYTVHFDPVISVNGEMADQSFAYDTPQKLTANGFSKTTGEWLRWNTASDGSGTDYDDQAEVVNLTAEDGGTVTLYAQWHLQHNFWYNNSIFRCYPLSNSNEVYRAYAGEIVQVEVVDATSEYTIYVTGKDGTEIDFDTGTNTFTMPEQDVNITSTALKHMAYTHILLDGRESFELEAYLYDAEHPTVTPSVTVKDGETTLTEGTHYTLAITNNTGSASEMVTAVVTVTGVEAGGYVGTATQEFRITPFNIANCEIKGRLESYDDGYGPFYPLTENVEVWNGETRLEMDTDYSLEIEEADAYTVGESYTATVKGKGDWGGTQSFSFTMIELCHTVTFDANGGTGTMDDDTVVRGEKYTLPDCAFDPPRGKVFECWEVSCGEESLSVGYYEGALYFTAPFVYSESDLQTITVKACWADKDEHSLTVSALEHGSLLLNGEEAALTEGVLAPLYEGDVITVLPDNGYALEDLTLTDADSGSVASENGVFTMPESDVTLSAAIVPIEYDIIYDLGENGTNGEGNPDSYTVESEDITLSEPSRPLSRFLGWTGTGLTEQTMTVTIPQGSTGARSYTAVWQELNDFTTCTAVVPDPVQDGYYYIGYSFEREGHGGIEVYDSNGVKLTYNTDYYYSGTETLEPEKYEEDGEWYQDFMETGYQCNHAGERCRVTLEGCGLWSGTLTADIEILSPSGGGEYGSLAWSYADGLLSITGSGDMAAADNNDRYPWFPYHDYITQIVIEEGVTSVAAKAFAGTANVIPYGNVSSVALPTTLTAIGDSAFAYMLALESVDLSHVLTIGEHAFIACGELTASVPAAVTSIGGGAFFGCGNVSFAVTVADADNGTVLADKEAAAEDETVSLTVTPAEGYELLSLSYTKTGSNTPVAITGNQFEMPDKNVTVHAEFGSPWEHLQSMLEQGGEITLSKDYTAQADEFYLYVPENTSVTLDLNGHTLDASATDYSVMLVRGALILKDSRGGGRITGGTANGGGVMVSAGSFTMNGGEISGNSALGDMDIGGGGVCVNGRAAFTMNGGTITDNSAFEGGGVYVSRTASFTMSGGAITGNTATKNNGGGVFTSESFTLSGDARIDGNGPDDVALNYASLDGTVYADAKILVGGELTGAAQHPISVRYLIGGDSPEAMVITDGLSGKGTAACFTSADSACSVRVNSDGEAELYASAATLKSYSLTLEGQIGLNYTVKIPEALQEGAQAVLSCKGKETVLALGEPLEGTTDEFRFTYRVPAKGIGNAISLRIEDGSGNTLTLLNAAGEAFENNTVSRSVADYCKIPNLGQYAEEGKGDALVALAAALQNYGASAQAYFDKGDEDPGYAGGEAPDFSGVTVTGFGVVKTGALEGLDQTTMFLTLQSETTINLRFFVHEGFSIDDYTFTCGETELTPVANGDSYLIKLENIPAKELDTAYTVTVTNGEKSFTITCSALSYAQLVLNHETLGQDEALCSALKAMYVYNQAADAYFAD